MQAEPDDFEEPDPDSDFDYEESARKKKKKAAAAAAKTPAKVHLIAFPHSENVIQSI